MVTKKLGTLGGTILLKKTNAQSITNSFEDILKPCKRKPKVIETDDGSGFVNKLFASLLKNNNIERYSRNTSLGVVFRENFNRTI